MATNPNGKECGSPHELLARYAARAQGAILDEVDAVDDTVLHERIRRAVLDQIELFQRRAAALFEPGGGLP